MHAAVGGEGPPVLLLHGFPQTHVMWHRVAPQLARSHTVVAADLRGYGDSSRPPTGDDHAGYSFAAMAADQRALMAELGHERFAVGHDRGARVAHRLALDAPDAVPRAALLDILPTAHVYDSVDRRLATAYYHWFFFIQPAPVPERLIAGDPIGYLHTLLGGWGGSGLSFYDPAALAEYERVFADPAARSAMLEDYRAGASVDYEQDSADAAAGRRVEAPVLVLWGARSVVGTGPDDPIEVWRSRAREVTGQVLDTGHFLAEERPAETVAALEDFLG